MTAAAAVQHAGYKCPRCAGNVMPRDEELACFQCGYIAAYFDRPYPETDMPYATPGEKTPKLMEYQEPQPREQPKPFGLTEKQAEAIFGNDRTAALWLLETKWPGGPVCPYCDSRRCAQESQDSKIGDEYAQYRCTDCGKRYSILSETPMQKSRTRPGTWLRGAHAIKANSELGQKPQSLARQIRCSKPAAQKIIEAAMQAEAENREIYFPAIKAVGLKGEAEVAGSREAQCREKPGEGRIECADQPPEPAEHREEQPTDEPPTATTEPDTEEAPASNPTTTAEPPKTARRETAEEPVSTSQEIPATENVETRKPAEAPETEPPESPEQPEKKDYWETRNDGKQNPESPNGTPPPPPGILQDFDWTLQECRTDLVKQREELAKRRDEMDAQITEKNRQIKRLDEAANIIDEWRSTRQ